jgi:hypothetical protein
MRSTEGAACCLKREDSMNSFGTFDAAFSDTIMADDRRSHIFCLCFLHRQRGLLVGSLKVSSKHGEQWQTHWDIGTIDRDPQLSDDWFCLPRYDHTFQQVLQQAANKCVHFKLPGATLRWGDAKGMPHEQALELAHKLFALWQEIVLDWESHGCRNDSSQ